MKTTSIRPAPALSTRVEPTVSEIAAIAASLRLSSEDDLAALVRTAIQLCHLSESKMSELARFQKETGGSLADWLSLDANEEKRRAWLNGEKPITSDIRSEIDQRVRQGELETEKLGAQGPPRKQAFDLRAVAEKILPQSNPTERMRSANKFLQLEIEAVGAASPFGLWLKANTKRRVNAHEVWWVLAELLIRRQGSEGRFRSGNRWAEALQKRRKESQPARRWEKYD